MVLHLFHGGTERPSKKCRSLVVKIKPHLPSERMVPPADMPISIDGGSLSLGKRVSL